MTVRNLVPRPQCNKDGGHFEKRALSAEYSFIFLQFLGKFSSSGTFISMREASKAVCHEQLKLV